MQKLRKKCGNIRKDVDEIISAYSAISACFRINNFYHKPVRFFYY